MKIAVMSDVHDHLENLERALAAVGEGGAEALLFLGDFCAPFSLNMMGEKYAGPIHAVLGNNDGDVGLLSGIAQTFPHVELHGLYVELQLGGRSIALHHYPDVAKRIAEGPGLDAVFSGHDHQRYVHQFEQTLWANPGEIMGRLGAPSFGWYDTKSHGFEHQVL